MNNSSKPVADTTLLDEARDWLQYLKNNGVAGHSILSQMIARLEPQSAEPSSPTAARAIKASVPPREPTFPPKSTAGILACLAQHNWRIVETNGLYELRRLGCHVRKIEVEELLDEGLIECTPSGSAYRITDAGRTRLSPTNSEMAGGQGAVCIACWNREMQPPGECIWTYDSDDDYWKTACGGAYVLNDGTPKENGIRFCLACAKPVKASETNSEMAGGQGADATTAATEPLRQSATNL